MKKRILAAVTAAMMFTTILSVVPVNTLAIDSAEQSASAPPSEEDMQLDWLPETEAEYYDFVDEYGHLSTHNYYIVYCDEVNYSTGDEVVVNQSGDGEIKKVKEYTISDDTPAAPGSSSKVVMVYVAVLPGDVQLTISQGRTWDPNAELTEKESGNYVVNDDYTIEEKNKDDILTVSVVDYDTGELILTDTDQCWSITLQAGFSVEYVLTDGTFAWGTAWADLETWSYGELNPCEIDTSLYSTGFGVDGFQVVDMYIPNDYFLPEDYLEINYKESDEYHTDFPTDITVKLKKTIMGDVNDDGSFNVSDVVLLQKWLLAVPDTHLANWKAADFCEDDRLDVFDLCLMKRELIEKMNDIPQNVDTSFKLQSVADIRTNGDNHTKWTGYIARSESDLLDIIKENEGVSADEISLEDIDDNVFNDKSLVIIYGICTAGNSYSIIDDISIKGTDIDVSTVSKKPEIATPDMLYRRYIYIIDKNAATNVSGFTFNDTSSFYQNDEKSDVVNWFKDWCRS